ncbi:hypothetical protein FCM35_KLT14422 [Carex littledalei]|uniref:Uncharacterized protein n=1 Tax=Carex littledalei TaxID=544730 RepID=A0A833QM59_9POAL|nr:hypothetical protein FCM35_KLT14422 [Carex littledalei]
MGIELSTQSDRWLLNGFISFLKSSVVFVISKQTLAATSILRYKDLVKEKPSRLSPFAFLSSVPPLLKNTHLSSFAFLSSVPPLLLRRSPLAALSPSFSLLFSLSFRLQSRPTTDLICLRYQSSATKPPVLPHSRSALLFHQVSLLPLCYVFLCDFCAICLHDAPSFPFQFCSISSDAICRARQILAVMSGKSTGAYSHSKFSDKRSFLPFSFPGPLGMLKRSFSRKPSTSSSAGDKLNLALVRRLLWISKSHASEMVRKMIGTSGGDGSLAPAPFLVKIAIFAGDSALSPTGLTPSNPLFSSCSVKPAMLFASPGLLSSRLLTLPSPNFIFPKPPVNSPFLRHQHPSPAEPSAFHHASPSATGGESHVLLRDLHSFGPAKSLLSVADGAVADGAVADGAVADGAVADGAVADGAVPHQMSM